MLAGAACLLLAGYMIMSGNQASAVSDAEELAAAGQPQRALDQLGNYDGAAQAFARAAQREPENWIIHRDWAVALAHAGDEEGARREITRAVELNPRMEVPALYVR